MNKGPVGLQPGQGTVGGVGTSNSANTPDGVTRPILLALSSVNQRFPSGPLVIAVGVLFDVGTVNSVIPPAVVMRPIRGRSVL